MNLVVFHLRKCVKSVLDNRWRIFENPAKNLLLSPQILSSSCSNKAVQVAHSPDRTRSAKTQTCLFKTNPIARVIFLRNKAGYCFFDKKTRIMTPTLTLTWIFPSKTKHCL